MGELVWSGNWVLPAAVFGTIMLGTWALLSFLADRDNNPLRRLRRLTPQPAGDLGGHGNSGDGMMQFIERAAPTLAAPLMPRTEVERSQLKLRLSAAGWRGEHAVRIYLGLRLVMTVAGALLAGSVALGLKGFQAQSGAIAAIGAGIGFFLPDVVVTWRRTKRQEAIFYALPDALDLMVVCVEAGLALDGAMRRVSQEIRRASPVLADELDLANMQLQVGRPRRDVLHDLGLRNGVDDLRSLAAILIQADRFGSSVGQALRVHADSMRTRRRQLAEERAQKTAVKLILPLVLFIFPGIFVILVGPAGIMIARNLGAATGTGE
jgi:tight adherence protein C